MNNRTRKEPSCFALHPISALVVTVLSSIAAFYFASWWIAGLVASIAAAGIASNKKGIERIREILSRMCLFAGIIVLANVLVGIQSGSVARGVLAGLIQSLRVAALVLVADLYIMTTDPFDLSDSVSNALKPLERFGVKVGAIALWAMLIASFMPLLYKEAKRLEIARALRCGFPKRGPGALRLAVPILVPLFVGVIRRSVEVDMALQARGYRLDGRRSTLRDLRPKMADFVVIAASCLAFVAAGYAKL